MIGKDNADANTARCFLVPKGERLAQVLDDLFRQSLYGFGAATQIWQDEEFVTPEASQHVARAEEGCHAAGGLTQQFVAGSMAKGVIDRLEAIDP